MKIENRQILQKIIDLQACIIQGKDIKALLHKNIDFYLENSGADIITIYIHDEGHVNVDYILERQNLFAHLVKKYILNKKNFKWENFVQNCDHHFLTVKQHDKVADLYQVFKGFLSKRESTSFSEELNMRNAVMVPMFHYDKKEIIGYVCYFFQTDTPIDIGKLEEVKTSFQILLSPLYDTEHTTFYTKCVRIDEDMKILTSQEKKIVKKVLEGMTYPDISSELYISINTLKTHMKNIFNKYNVNSKIELSNKLNGSNRNQ